MGQRRDTGVARHTGGWIVLGTGLLAICLFGSWTREPDSPLPAAEDSPAGQSVAAPLNDLHRFPQLRIDINEADQAELSCIEGIGPALAQRIIAHRQRVGRFRSLAELDEVPGVGPQLVRRLETAMQPLPDVETAPEAEPEVAAADPARLVGRTIKLPINESPE